MLLPPPYRSENSNTVDISYIVISETKYNIHIEANVGEIWWQNLPLVVLFSLRGQISFQVKMCTLLSAYYIFAYTVFAQFRFLQLLQYFWISSFCFIIPFYWNYRKMSSPKSNKDVKCFVESGCNVEKKTQIIKKRKSRFYVSVWRVSSVSLSS